MGRKTLTCPVCGEPLENFDVIITCPDCDTKYHFDCWQANGGCAMPYCKYYSNKKSVELDVGKKTEGDHFKKHEMDDSDEKICPWCAKEIGEEDTIECPSCGIEYHFGCWALNGGCATPKCDYHSNQFETSKNQNNKAKVEGNEKNKEKGVKFTQKTINELLSKILTYGIVGLSCSAGGLILGLILVLFPPTGWIFQIGGGIVGIIFSRKGKNEANTFEKHVGDLEGKGRVGKNLCKAGFIVGIVQLSWLAAVCLLGGIILAFLFLLAAMG